MPITSTINITLDGFCNHEDVAVDSAFIKAEAVRIRSSDALLLGHGTFRIFQKFWPAAARALPEFSVERELALAIDETPRLLVSRSTDAVDWPGTEIIRELSQELAIRLSEERNLLLIGSPSILSQLSAWDCIDTYHFFVQPVRADKGVRLFHDMDLALSHHLELRETEQFPQGAVRLTYSRKDGDRRLIESDSPLCLPGWM